MSSLEHRQVWLFALREARGWSQERLAREAGCSWRAVQRWESCKAQPSDESIEKLAIAFRVRPAQIIGYEALEGIKVDSMETRVNKLTLQVGQVQEQLNRLYQRIEPGDS